MAEMKFKPKMIGFVCNWCCYGGADLAGVSRFQYPPHIRLVRVMCSGRVDFSHIFTSFMTGEDGVFVGGCHLGDCHYITNGNYDAISLVQLSKRLLEHIGINPKRLRIEWVSAGEGIRFANIMNEFSAEICELGPLGYSENMSFEEIRERISEIMKLFSYIKIEKRDKLRTKFSDTKMYENLFTLEEVKELIENAPVYWIDPEKCAACTLCAKVCPVDAIEGRKGVKHVIDQSKCIKCGTCFKSCPPKFSAVKKLIKQPVPEPLPLNERIIKINNSEQMKI